MSKWNREVERDWLKSLFFTLDKGFPVKDEYGCTVSMKYSPTEKEV